MRSACTGTSTDRSTVPSATRCSTASAQRTWSDDGVPGRARLAGRLEVGDPLRRAPPAARRISSSVGGSSSGSETRRSDGRDASRPRLAGRRVAPDRDRDRRGDTASARAASARGSPRRAPAARRARAARRRAAPGPGSVWNDSNGTMLPAQPWQEDALAARPAADVLAQRADEVGRGLGHVGADDDRMRRERDDGADRAAVLVVDADHRDVAVALLVGVPAEDRPALDALAPVDGQLLGDRPRPADAAPAAAVRAASAATETSRSPTTSA